MKDYKPILLQLLNECMLAHLEMIFLTPIDFSEWELVLLSGVRRQCIIFCSRPTTCWVCHVKLLMRAGIFKSSFTNTFENKFLVDPLVLGYGCYV